MNSIGAPPSVALLLKVDECVIRISNRSRPNPVAQAIGFDDENDILIVESHDAFRAEDRSVLAINEFPKRFYRVSIEPIEFRLVPKQK